MNRFTVGGFNKWWPGAISGVMLVLSAGCATTTPSSLVQASYASGAVAD
ncbi:MAG: hypothetical protein H6978_09340 [Gammaproteobacteria bacterium]|nr:hypothetical protein [Gammaproteobacteria bacterium]